MRSARNRLKTIGTECDGHHRRDTRFSGTTPAVNPPPTIVVVDDSPDVRTLVRAQIRMSKRLEVVGEGTNGLDAVALATRHQPDLMLLDVSMPVIDGLTALPKVIDASPQTRVVMYTGFDEKGLAARAAELGAAAFVEKSAPFEVLLKTLVDLADDHEGGGDFGVVPERRSGLDPVLEDHLERFREVFEDAAIGMATMTLAGRIVRANRSLAELLETPVDQLVGVALAELAEERERIEDALLSMDAGESVVEVEHRTKTSPDRTLRSTLSPVIDARGRPLYVFLQVQDVTGQLAAEAALRRTEARFKLLVEAVEDYAIFMLDPTGRISSWNAGAERSKGYAAEEIIGQHFRVFYPSEKQAEMHPEHELEEALLHGRYEEEGWRVRKDGSRFWANVTITAVRDPDGELVGFAKVTRDTTERLEMLQRLEEANRQLEEANRQLAEAAEQQAQFFAVTAHELRSPVGVLTGATSTLATHFDDLAPQDRAEIAQAITNSSAQLRHLLDDLLTASRLQARRLQLDPVDVDLREHLHSAAGALRQSARSTQIRVAEGPPLQVRVDPVRLTQMVDNLVVNAIRHGAPPIDISADADSDLVEIVVRDAGSGVSEELQGRLFERFATGSSRGTGLGLFLVRELARAHGGDARYRPSDGAFVVSLPRSGR
ncbi:MAG: PAS domain S-box protein [Propionibacteriales bacterium]|nr:PAS domain S-box protein [Propionibacteriales bacterium]